MSISDVVVPPSDKLGSAVSSILSEQVGGAGGIPSMLTVSSCLLFIRSQVLVMIEPAVEVVEMVVFAVVVVVADVVVAAVVVAVVVLADVVVAVVVVPTVVVFATPIVGQRRKISALFAIPALQFSGEYPRAPVVLRFPTANTTNWSEFSLGQLTTSRSELVTFFTTRKRMKDDGLTMVIYHGLPFNRCYKQMESALTFPE